MHGVKYKNFTHCHEKVHKDWETNIKKKCTLQKLSDIVKPSRDIKLKSKPI